VPEQFCNRKSICPAIRQSRPGSMTQIVKVKIFDLCLTTGSYERSLYVH
jgi:hypothetical protein